MQDFSLAIADLLPEKKSLQRLVQWKRVCPQGNELGNELRVTPKGEVFVLEEDEPNGFYMFSSQKNWIYSAKAQIGFVTVCLTLRHSGINYKQYTRFARCHSCTL